MTIQTIHEERVGEHVSVNLVKITEPGHGPRQEWEMVCDFCDEICTGLRYEDAIDEASQHHHDGTEGDNDAVS
jgi:hypothetical protein